MPSFGGSMNSSIQREYFDSESGIDGMRRSMSGIETSKIDRLTGIFLGIQTKTIFRDFYMIRFAGSYCNGFIGGSGKSIFYSTDYGNYYQLECDYSFWEFDFPLTLGLSIPFWKDAKIFLSCGVAFAYGEYKNKFTSSTYPDPFTRKGSFSKWAFPLIVLLEGEYFISSQIAVNSTISYYRGSTKVLTDNTKNDYLGFGMNGAVDYAKIDFSGYRFSMGVSYYYYSI